MATREATTHWTGGLNSGSGALTLDSSNSARFNVTFPRRIGEPEGTSSPEELLAAALEKDGLTPKTIDVTAAVTVEPSDGGLTITTVAITLRAAVDGVDDERFGRLAQQAKDTCPVSRALAGTTITLDAALA
jgi:osmotically inducible protein OsmC